MNKDNLLKIKEEVIKFRQGLSQRQKQFILYGSLVVLLVMALLLFHRPLAIKLDDAESELKVVNAQVLRQRSDIAALKKAGLETRLMHQEEVSLAIGEITEQGMALGINFVSITPSQQQQVLGDFKKLPIDFQIESTYSSLGEFLAYLEEFPRSAAAIESLSVDLDEKAPSTLKVRLSINLYLEGQSAKR